MAKKDAAAKVAEEEVVEEAPTAEEIVEEADAPAEEVSVVVDEAPVEEVVDHTLAAVEQAHKNSLRIIRADLQAEIDRIDAELAE